MSAEKLAADVLEEINSMQGKSFTFDQVYENREEVNDEVSAISTYSRRSKRELKEASIALKEEGNILMKELMKVIQEVRSDLTDVRSKLVNVTTKIYDLEEKQIEDKKELTSNIARNTLDPNTILLATNLLAEDDNRISSNVTNRGSKDSKKAKSNKNVLLKEDSSSGSDVIIHLIEK